MKAKSKLNPAWLLAGFLALVFLFGGWMAFRSLLPGRPGGGAPDGSNPAAATVTPEVAALPALVAAQYAADGIELRARLAAGRAAYQAGDYAAAITALRTVIALSNGDSNTQTAFFLLGNIYDGLGQYADAAFCQNQALGCGPFAAAWYNLALTELHRGQPEAAKDAVNQALALNPGQPDYHALLAVACEQLSQYSQAEAAAQASIAGDSPSTLRLLNLALLTARAGRHDHAVTLLLRALAAPGTTAARRRAATELALLLYDLGRSAAAVTAMEQALTFAPGDPELLYDYGLALNKAKRWTEAIATLRLAHAAAPTYAPALYALSDALAERKLYREAIAAARRGLELDPENTERYYRLALLFIEEKEDEATRLTLEQILTIGAPHELTLAARAQLANLAARRGEHAAALTLMQKAADLSPQTPWVLFNRGVLAWRAGEKTEAYHDLDNALRRLPDHPLFASSRADLLYLDQRYTDAIAAYNKLLAIDRASVHARVQLGWLHQQRREYPAAGDNYRQALARQPEASLFYLLTLNLASVEAGSGRRREALELLRTAINQFPTRFEAYHNAALFSAELGHADEAMAFIRVAERLAPDAAAVPLARGGLLWRAGLRAEAAAAWERALALDPTLLAARYNLDYYQRLAAAPASADRREELP